MAQNKEEKVKTKFLHCVFAVVCIALLSACNPARWEHVDIQQINSNGDIVETWIDAKILSTGPRAFTFTGGDAWVLFETKDGKKVSLMVPHRFLYR